MARLTLALKAEYFNAIKAGTKTEEFRLCTRYWSKRLQFRSYDEIELTLGYPNRYDAARRMRFVFRGVRVITITHPHFGPDPVEVFAIDVTERIC